MTSRITAIYRVADNAANIEARATTIAVEQSVEMPVSAITKREVLDNIVGTVEGISDLGGGTFEIHIGLAVSTTGLEAGQMLNMLFGNSSLHADIVLHDAIFPDEVVRAFAGPHHGIAGLRKRVGAGNRALTCSALKPQGLSPEELAELAAQFTRGGIDYIKDDHGIADQAYSPFATRVPAIAAAVRKAQGTVPTRYLPSLSGNLDQLRRQIEIVRKAELDGALIAPMIVGVPSFHTLVRENPDIAFMAHPAMAGAAHLTPAFHLGTLFRLFGADATVFPNHGGRFSYSRATCLAIADAARRPWRVVKPTLPVPAGGMTVERVPEMIDGYGRDTMLLIGGGLLTAGDRLLELAGPRRKLGAPGELPHDDPNDVRQMEPGAEDDRGDVAQLVDRRLVRLLHALDPGDEHAPVLVDDRLEHVVLGLEVVVQEPVGDARLLGQHRDVESDPAPSCDLRPEHPLGWRRQQRHQ